MWCLEFRSSASMYNPGTPKLQFWELCVISRFLEIINLSSLPNWPVSGSARNSVSKRKVERSQKMSNGNLRQCTYLCTATHLHKLLCVLPPQTEIQLWLADIFILDANFTNSWSTLFMFVPLISKDNDNFKITLTKYIHFSKVMRDVGCMDWRVGNVEESNRGKSNKKQNVMTCIYENAPTYIYMRT